MQRLISAAGFTVRCRSKYRYRSITVFLLTTALLVPLLAACGCHDVEGAASGTAGQLGERARRDKEAMDILGSSKK